MVVRLDEVQGRLGEARRARGTVGALWPERPRPTGAPKGTTDFQSVGRALCGYSGRRRQCRVQK